MRLLVATLLLLAACGTTRDQAVRHTLLAAVIERAGVPESNIEVQHIAYPGPATATAVVIVQEQGARAARQAYRATLLHRDGHWELRDLQPEP
jgi:hypothetical protein